MITDLDKKFLKEHIKFYNNLLKEEKELFDSKLIHTNIEKNKLIHTSDNDCSGLIIILSGQLRVFLNSAEGKEITIYRLLPKDTCILSASCIFNNINFNINIEAYEYTEVLILPSNYLSKLSKSNHSLQEYLLELTQSKLSDVMWIIEQIVFTSVDKRILNYLRTFNSKIIKITHETIAKDLGTAREVVSRMLKYFEKEGMVKLSRGTIEIINLNK